MLVATTPIDFERFSIPFFSAGKVMLSVYEDFRTGDTRQQSPARRQLFSNGKCSIVPTAGHLEIAFLVRNNAEMVKRGRKALLIV